MKLALIGAGAMGEALLAGWLATELDAADVGIVDAVAERVAQLEERYGVHGVGLAQAGAAETVVLAVKPHQITDLLAELAPGLRSDALVISIAAGLTLDTLAAALPAGQPLVRVMPNTPSLLGQGMAGIAVADTVEADQRERAVTLMNAVGRAITIPESAMDALTAVSGSGPAYLFHIAEAMIEAGVQQGLTRDQATVLVNQTFVGAAAMLDGAGETATTLRERVTSPGGTTAAALRTLDDHGVRAAIFDAVDAAARRSRELGA